MIEAVPSGQWRPALERAFDFAQQQVHALVERDPDFYPMYTEGGRWRHAGEAWTRWCDGFLPGMMWIFYRRTKDRRWRELAERYTLPLEARKHDRDVHDLGFLFLSTYHRWHELEGGAAQKEILAEAGRTLALRFQEKGRYLCSFLGPELLFIDIMANVGIIFWAGLETGNETLLRIATGHCLTTRRVLVRGDGSAAHEGIFDRESGEFLRQSTQQGFRADSCWSRGLSWAIYGFTAAYQMTRDRRFLQTAERCAEFFLRETPPGGVAFWDYDAPQGPPQPRDSSASAIAAAGLLRLANVRPGASQSYAWRAAALRVLASLCEPLYLASATPGWEGILKEGVYHLHKGLGVGESVMWGEYFFVEAVDRALRSDAGSGRQ